MTDKIEQAREALERQLKILRRIPDDTLMLRAELRKQFADDLELALRALSDAPARGGGVIDAKIREASADFIAKLQADPPFCEPKNGPCDDVLRCNNEGCPYEKAAPSAPAGEGEALCPFCGSLDSFVESATFVDAYVVCNNCEARGPVECQDDDNEDQPGADAAKRAWNRRVCACGRRSIGECAPFTGACLEPEKGKRVRSPDALNQARKAGYEEAREQAARIVENWPGALIADEGRTARRDLDIAAAIRSMKPGGDPA